ncbi:SWIM zinc finger family protein [Salarchaeum japonicum]|uniref:SWIM-type domain-containing protein n=1 Tax=Salarchaeum japonicum TaxID=555573 RepID=A0AAV3T1C3_9EURY|nr:SWIM zinc finger family protein [Salarchaeum japonicum]
MVPSKHTSTTTSEPTALSPGGPTRTRADRARTERMAVTPLGGGRYEVVTEYDTVYTVHLPESRCTCPDYRHRRARCKHLRRVAIDVTAGRVPAPGQREAACADCERPVYVAADEPSPVYCDSCTLDTGRFVRDRERGDLLVVARTTRDRANTVEVPGWNTTVADYPTNRGYPETDVVVDVLYPIGRDLTPDDLAPTDLKRYAFPRSRLESLGRPD